MRTHLRRFAALLSTASIALSMLGGTHVRCDDSAMGPGAAAMTAHGVPGAHAGMGHDGERTAGVLCHEDASSPAPDATGCTILAHCVSAALVTADVPAATAPPVSWQPAGKNDARPHDPATPPDSPPPRA
jgi:hypothetical protein